MASSVLAGRLANLLGAFGWTCSANRFTVTAIEPTALEPVRHVWLAGDAAHLSAGEIKQVRPARVIVQDAPPDAEIRRIEECLVAANLEPRVSTFTNFVDLLWDASLAAERARKDSQLKDPLFKPLFADLQVKTNHPDARHARQKTYLGDLDVLDHRLLEVALPTEGTWFALLADAGLGKSELLQWHEWKYSVFYESARSQRSKNLPPVAIRVPLRGLRVLTFDAIAHYLSRPDPDDDLPALTRLNSGACLVELLRMGRIILFLDGIDELMITREKLEDGLREIEKAVLDGGRVVLAARRGDLTTRRTLEEFFSYQQTARIEPMPTDAGQDLLVNYGASLEKANEIVQRLRPSPAHGIPLFLLMAYSVDLSSPLQSPALQSRTAVLGKLLALFCKRDESRLGGLSTEEQLDMLTYFAHLTGALGEMDAKAALDHLGLDQAEPAAAMILNPHALLTRTANNTIKFKYPTFEHYFSAKAMADDWARYGFRSIVEDLRSRRLDGETIEDMARLVEASDIAVAWTTSAEEFRHTPLVRRNLLALALARLEDDLPGGKETERSKHLAHLLGNRKIVDVSLVDLTLVRLDLTGWTLARLQGRGGSLHYCVNMAGCEYDGSIHTIGSFDGTDIPADIDDTAPLTAGADRLKRLLNPLRRKGSDVLFGLLNVDECKDMDGWQKLRRAGYATDQRRSGGQRNWVIQDDTMPELTRFLQVDARQPAKLRDFLKSEPKLRKLLLSLAK